MASLADLRHFSDAKYLESGKKVYSERKNVEVLADKIAEKHYKNIMMIGIGGTYMEWEVIATYLKHITTEIPVYVENAGELVVKKILPYLSKDTLVLTSSVSGDTKEILEAVKFCKRKGIAVYGITSSPEKPLAKLLKGVVYNKGTEGGCENSYLLDYMLTLRILNDWGYYKDYDRWADQMKNLYTNLLRFRKEFEMRGRKIARKYYKSPLTMTVGSGILWGETKLFSMCILEEMQWVRTRPVPSAEFFHGALELVDDSLPVFLIKGEDEFRPLDDRVERFAKKFTNKLEVFDTKDYTWQGIDDDFRIMLSPMIITSILTDRLATLYSLNTGHDLNFRRYYRQFVY